MASAENTAFFSYSREDSEFSLRLAADLKAAGAYVWLDQLDIAPGQRWDGAVENALKSCPRLLLVMSPSSVGSENVKDEVSFAFDQAKTIIPVLYRDCEVPFRLRRLQYIDLRANYERGLEELLKTLRAQPAQAGGAAPEVAAQPGAGVSAEHVGPAARAMRRPAEGAIRPQPVQSVSSLPLMKIALFGVAILVVAVVLFYSLLSAGGPSITSLSPTSGPPGTEVAITGKNFGNTQGAVKFGFESASPLAWSATSSTVKVPNLAAGPANVVVSVNNKDSAPATFSVSGKPSASSISPSAGPPGTTVTITGANFRSTQGSSNVRFGTVSAPSTYWSGNSISATVPNVRPGESTAVVSVDGIESSPLRFTVTGNGSLPHRDLSGGNSAEYQRVKDRLAQTQAQADAVFNQWSRTQAEVARGGGSLRTDVQTALNLLKRSMSQANSALQAGALDPASRSLDTAEQQMKLLQQYAE